jgi:hypothetical protein
MGLKLRSGHALRQRSAVILSEAKDLLLRLGDSRSFASLRMTIKGL